VVHGDYRPHNAIFDGGGELHANLDSELATLGEPLADFSFAQRMGRTRRAGRVRERPSDRTSGLSLAQRTRKRYSELTGTSLDHLPYYRAFNAWKAACIQLGVYARYRTGQKSTVGVDVSAVRAGIEHSIASSMAQADGL
jgi:aminoglycoside phosphotransferase (APT) family kinase protein